MALISIVMQPTWREQLNDLSTAFTRSEGDDKLEVWRELDFEERFDYVDKRNPIPADDRWLKDALAQSKGMAQKNQETAESFRLDGNRKFQRKWYQQAMDEYTQCIRYALDVGVGYSNRSAALYHLRAYKHCILDINRALKAGLPKKLHYKVYNRRALCWKELDCHSKAREDFEMALSVLPDAEVEKSRSETLKKEFDSEVASLSTMNGSEPEPDLDVYPRPRVPEVVGGNSDHVTQASKFVEISYDEERGRHLIAGHDLSPGEALISECPYAAVLLQEFYSSHCHHCFTRTLAPIPCDHCPIVLYCTEQCRDQAWTRYHRTECPYLPLLHMIGIAHLALRIIVVSGLQYLEEFRSHANEVYDWRSRYEYGYESVHRLLHHTDNMQTPDLVQYTICAIILQKTLKDANFFTRLDGTQAAESEAFIGGLILRHIQQLVCNAHAVSDWSLSGGSERNEQVCDVSDARVATAIYPTASLMNHSCDPNILSNFYNDVLVVRCTRLIKKGEEIFNCYGPHCKRMEKYERQQILDSQYFFTCQCTACSDVATTIERHKALKCPSCEGPLPRPRVGEVGLAIVCASCGKTCSKQELDAILPVVFRSQRTMVEAMQAADAGDTEGAKELFRKCLKEQKQVLYKEHEDMAATCDQLARIYTLEENYKKAEPYVDFSVKVVGRIHGYQSIEYGTELKKLAQIQFNALMVDKCRKNSDRAFNVLKANLGDENDQVQELVKMMKCLSGAKGQF